MKQRVQKFGAPLVRKFLDTSRQIIQLMRKVSNRVEKARNYPNACKYQRVPSGAFWGEGATVFTRHWWWGVDKNNKRQKGRD